jgi:hypothetical protein
MVDVLEKMNDLRARKLMKVLAQDRSEVVSGRARTALALTPGKAVDMNAIVEKRKRKAAAREAKAAGKSDKSKAPKTTPEQKPAGEAYAYQPAVRESDLPGRGGGPPPDLSPTCRPWPCRPCRTAASPS